MVVVVTVVVVVVVCVCAGGGREHAKHPLHPVCVVLIGGNVKTKRRHDRESFLCDRAWVAPAPSWSQPIIDYLHTQYLL